MLGPAQALSEMEKTSGMVLQGWMLDGSWEPASFIRRTALHPMDPHPMLPMLSAQER